MIFTARRYASAIYAVRLSQVSVLLKQPNVGSRKQRDFLLLLFYYFTITIFTLSVFFSIY